MGSRQNQDSGTRGRTSGRRRRPSAGWARGFAFLRRNAPRACTSRPVSVASGLWLPLAVDESNCFRGRSFINFEIGRKHVGPDLRLSAGLPCVRSPSHQWRREAAGISGFSQGKPGPGRIWSTSGGLWGAPPVGCRPLPSAWGDGFRGHPRLQRPRPRGSDRCLMRARSCRFSSESHHLPGEMGVKPNLGAPKERRDGSFLSTDPLLPCPGGPRGLPRSPQASCIPHCVHPRRSSCANCLA